MVARRFRPRTFEEVVGQEAVLRSLAGALHAGEVPHAFLFAGSRGVGKTTTARILARALNCASGVTPKPCGECEPCKSILAGRNPDVMEIDAASHNLVDDIRELRERVAFASMGSRYKVYILDEVHMLTRSAFNAFLKTLEEPPAGVVFVLATTELHKVPDTIRSRCQVFLFNRVGEDDIAHRLRGIADSEGVAVEDDVLQEIALTSRGGMRDAETALERVLSVAREHGGSFDLDAYRQIVHRAGLDRTAEVVEGLLRGDAALALRFADEVVRAGVDEREALGELLDVLRSVLVLAIDGRDSALVAARGPLRERLVELATGTDLAKLDAVIQAGLLGRERIRRLDDRRLVLELSLLRMARVGQLPALAELAQAVAAGGSATSAGSAPSGAAMPVPLGAPPVAASPAGGDLRAKLIAAVRAVKPMLGSTVEACAVHGPDASGRIVLRARTKSRMHRDRLASPEVQTLIRRVAVEVAGDAATVGFELDDEPAAGSAPPGRAPPAADAPLPPEVERIRARFDGRVVDADPDD
ncbi:MAG: DNA polymerase III subunit gamma/tau [Planctomycetes bacterium]|nr:DNA polymerase III subunit gamma/tau [Planctomycetota bacterium]